MAYGYALASEALNNTHWMNVSHKIINATMFYKTNEQGILVEDCE